MNDNNSFSSFFVGSLLTTALYLVFSGFLWRGDLIDERINKICLEAKVKEYQLETCKYSAEFEYRDKPNKAVEIK